MRLHLLASFVVALSLLIVPMAAATTTTTTLPTCDNGGTLCNAQCHTSSACATSGGNTYTGICIGGSNQASATCPLTHCGSTTPVCAAPTNISGVSNGCATDAACGTGYICVSSIGPGGCGTGWAQCISSCSDSTTTSTSTTATTSSSTST